MIYLIELIVAISWEIITLAIILLLKKEKPKKFLNVFIIIALLFVIIFIITLILEKPKINIQKEDLTIEVQSDSVLKIPQTTYLFFDVTNKVEREGNVDYNTIGDYEITYKVPKLLGKYRQKATVHIVDTIPPELNILGEIEYNQSYATKFQDPGYTANDAYEGDLTEKVIVEKFKYTDTEFEIKYTVSDSSENEVSKTRKIHIIDDVPPVITLNGGETITLKIGENYIEKGAKAEDKKDGNLTENIEITGKVDTSKAGTYEITYKVSDANGNKASKKRKVIVKSEQIKSEEVKPQIETNNKKGVIYLTFDDGPSAYTSKLLDILKKYNVLATFFVTNQSLTKGYDSVILRAYKEGHTIGLHTSSHNYNIYQSEETYFNDLYAIQEKVKRITGYTSTIIRFPGGSSNTISKSYDGGTNIMSQLTKAVEAKGFKYWDWNIDSRDAETAKTSGKVASNIINSLGNSSTYVVLQHDIKKYSVDAVEQVIQYGIANGYTFKPITMDTYAVHHKVNN